MASATITKLHFGDPCANGSGGMMDCTKLEDLADLPAALEEL
jgi:hypothetical protein